MFRILQYRAGSRSARALATALGGRCVIPNGQYQRRVMRDRRIPNGDTVINWGQTDPFVTEGVLNGTGIREASNKLRFFQLLSSRGEGELAPRFWTRPSDIPDDAFPIVCRTVLAGHSGEGIVIAANRRELVPCSLYVQYIKKEAEFRIHVGRLRLREGYDIISEQRKVRRSDHPNPNFQIRSHANGFIFQRHGIVVPESVRGAARRALAATSLDFGAVDVIYNSRQSRPYVLEINTAPGLEGETVTDYVSFFTNGGRR